MAIPELDLTKQQCVKFEVEGHEPSLLPKGKKFKLAWADEFDGGTLDKSKWGFRTHFWQHKAPQFCERGVSLDGKSNLIIEPVLMEDGRICSAQLQTSTNTLDLPKDIPFIPEYMQVEYQLLNNKVILPSEEELLENKRSHSAKMRGIEKIK